MDILPFQQHIASTFHDLCGAHGAITAEAQRRHVHRQTIYRESAKVQAQLLHPDWPNELAAAQQRIADLHAQVDQLQAQLAVAVVLDQDKQAELACVGQANGVSLPTLRTLLAVLLPRRTPSVAKLGRWTKAAGERAGQLLRLLDEQTQPKVTTALLDEIYTKDPVLMVVEPESLCWTTGQRCPEATGEAWQKALRPLSNLEMVARDAGSGLTRGLKLHNQERAAQARTPVAEQLDHFHSLRAGGRGLSRAARAARRALALAEQTQQEIARRQRQARSCLALGKRAACLWRKAERAMDVWSTQERQWQQAQEALRLVTPEGTLNTRARATAALTAALAPLPDQDFGKSKRQLAAPETLTYLDRVQQQLAALPAPAAVTEAAVRQECLQRRPELLQGSTPQAAALRGVVLVCAVVLANAGAVGQTTAAAVRVLFRRAFRASSLVECLNSVVRMQQARHRKLTQGLLDLKRLHWNCHRFRTGPRRGHSPYEHLGVQLPAGVSWWELLHWPPEQLREKLSALNMAA